MSWQFSAEQLRQVADTVRDWQRYRRDLIALLVPGPSRASPRAGFGFGYTTAAASTAGNVATAGMLKICVWAQTTATTFTFTDLGQGSQPCITPDPAGMPAGKRVWWTRDVQSGVIVIRGALCPLTTTDPAPATPPVAMTTGGGQAMTSGDGQTMMTG